MTTLDTARRRSTILDHLRDGPLDKRDLLDRVTASRSTVDRAIEELLDRGLVRRADGGYETTLPGVLALERAREYDSDADAIAAATPALTPLWKETDIGLDLLRGADVSTVAEAGAVRLLTELGSAVRNADEVRGAFPQIARPEGLETFYDRAEGGADLDLVLSEPLFETLASTFPGWLRGVALDGAGRVAVGPVPEYGLLLCRAGGRREAFLLTYDEGRLHGVLRNDGAAATWAAERFWTLRGSATERRERIRGLDGDAGFTGLGDATPPFGDTAAVAGGSGAGADRSGDLLGSGYAVDDGRLRTPAFGAEGSCTVAFWMRPTDPRAGWQVLVKWDFLELALRRGELYGTVYDPEAEEPRARVAASIEELDADRWQHVAYTYDQRRARLFVDGEPVDEAEDDYPLSIDAVGASLGYHYRDTGVHDPTYAGRLYDARFYGVALPPAAIHRLATATDPTAVVWGVE